MVGQSIASFNIVQIPRILLGSSACASDVTSSSENCGSRQSPMPGCPVCYGTRGKIDHGPVPPNRAWAFMVSH